MRRMISRGGRLEVHADPAIAAELERAGALAAGRIEDLEGTTASHYRGRGTPRVLQLDGVPPIVVKSLRHGGLFGGVLGEWFLGPGRLLRVLELLAALRDAGIPTARPAFARIHRGALAPFCRLELGTYQIQGAVDAAEFLRHVPPVEELRWFAERLGELLARLHAAGILHADLNLRNLLVVPGERQILVIDCEGSRRFPGQVPRDAAVSNWERLLRSYHKLRLSRTGVPASVLARVLRAYDREHWREWWRRTLRRYRRTAALHHVFWVLDGRGP